MKTESFPCKKIPCLGMYEDLEWSKFYLVGDFPNYSSGVYIILDKDDNSFYPIYIGQSKSIAGRVFQHTFGKNPNLRDYLKNNSCFFTFTVIKSAHKKDRIERELIEKYHPEFNRMPGNTRRRIRKMSFLQCYKKTKSMYRTIMMFYIKRKQNGRLCLQILNY